MTNMIMRHCAQSSSVVTNFKRDFQDFPITINELCKHVENMPHNNLADSHMLMRFRIGLRSTRSYWAKCKGDLIDLLDQLGTPTNFSH